jgi:hypothetical protein
VISVTPANGTSFKARAAFDAVWRVRNIGKKTWDRNSVDYTYASGSKLHTVSTYDLRANLSPGETANITVDMEAPKDPGTFSTTWYIRAGSNNFCSLGLTILVK